MPVILFFLIHLHRWFACDSVLLYGALKQIDIERFRITEKYEINNRLFRPTDYYVDYVIPISIISEANFKMRIVARRHCKTYVTM